MKFIIFADCHYGYKGGAKQSIDEVIDRYENEYSSVDKILILGDFIDLWRRTVSDVLIEYSDLFDYLESQRGDVVYCKGNHDFIIDELLKDRDIDVVDKYKFGNYIFEHGHYIDYLSMSKVFISLDEFMDFAKEMCYSDTTTGNFLSRVWNVYKLVKSGFGSTVLGSNHVTINSKFNKMDNLSDVLYGRFRKCIIGHFHYYWRGRNLISLPAFCDNYFVVFDSNRCYVYRYGENIDLVDEFSVNFK